MFLHGCERILHKQQLYIFGLLSGDCSNDSSLRETGFLQTALDPSSVRVNFSNLEEYGDFPPTHGDIPMVFDRLYELRQVFSSTFNTRSFSFLTNGSIYCLLQVWKIQVILLVRILYPDSLSMRNAFDLKSQRCNSFSFFSWQFHVYSFTNGNTKIYTQYNWHAILIGWMVNSGNAREMQKSFFQPVTNFWTEVWWAGDA